MQYSIIYSNGENSKEAAEKLAEVVQKYIANGWEPQGGVSITMTVTYIPPIGDSGTYFARDCSCTQAMIKK
ncbi:MAG TPA: hypothetical protein ACFYD4_09680 [Candidatus Wunengus sp. YC61]|uniref:hypothetical protein n=1 Tax=Candidatus Wunengus sp. YC61 TaxID=3367698 RepID=UPI004029F917